MRSVRSLIRQNAWRLKDFEPEEALIVCSSPRGGSTWLAEMLARVPRTCIVWEPLNIASIDACRALGFSWRQHVPEDVRWPEAERYFEQLFRGRLFGSRMLLAASRAEFLLARRLLFKFTRANALLPWLTLRFDFRYRPVYLVRHPFAVVASQLRHGGWEERAPRELMARDRLMDSPHADPYRAHREYLLSLETAEEYLTARWCLTNLVPLRSSRNDDAWITVFYEHLLADPERQLRRIFSSWDIPAPSASEDIRAPSFTTRTATFEEGVEEQLAKWRSRFSEDLVGRMAHVLDHFEVREYSTELTPRVPPGPPVPPVTQDP